MAYGPQPSAHRTLWLAARGWQVTGAELSTTALERSAAHADQPGLSVTWQHLDLTREPPTGTYDLVCAFYVHQPAAQRRTLFAHLAAAVASGGTLLVVGHDVSDRQTTMPRPGLEDMGWTTDELVDALGDAWSIDVAEARPRSATDPDGREITIHDAVVRAHKTLV